MDRLHTMAVFVSVAEEAGFAPAARRLNMSPPSVTRAMSELEARLGCRLLHRTTRSMQLTDAGRRYLEDCRQILADVERADLQAAGAHSAPSGAVFLTSTVLLGRIVVAPILLDLLDRYPEISMTTMFVNRVVHLIDEGIDIAVRLGELPDSGLSAVRVGSVRRVLCASPDYLAERGRLVAPSELSEHEIIDFVDSTPGGEWRFENNGEIQAFRPNARLRLNNADDAIAAAVSGRGVTRVLSYMIVPHLQDGSLEIVLAGHEPQEVPIHVVHKEAGQTSARVRATVDHLVAAIRKSPALK